MYDLYNNKAKVLIATKLNLYKYQINLNASYQDTTATCWLLTYICHRTSYGLHIFLCIFCNWTYDTPGWALNRIYRLSISIQCKFLMELIVNNSIVKRAWWEIILGWITSWEVFLGTHEWGICWVRLQHSWWSSAVRSDWIVRSNIRATTSWAVIRIDKLSILLRCNFFLRKQFF